MTLRNGKDLLGKYLNNTCSEYERRLVESWYLGEMKDTDPMNLTDDRYLLANKKLKKSLRKLQRQERSFSRLWIAAASVIILFSVGLYLYKSPSAAPEKVATNVATDHIVPGKNMAIVTLSDGKILHIDESTRIKLDTHGGIVLSQISKELLSINTITGSKNILMVRSIAVPKGGQFQIILPDQTKVWLNSETKLLFPDNFALSQRHVTLQGEAYFEVSKDKHHPFTVAALNKKIEVLGTHFNVRAYPTENTFKTTLLEGKVRVTDLRSGQVSMLRPHQEFTAINNLLKIREAVSDGAVAWKNGYFDFNDKSLETAMEELARWYNVNIDFRNEQSRDVVLGGTMSRYSNIDQILNKIELTGLVHFTISNHTIIVH